jgi:type I restriction enzyme, S subunit
MGNVPKLRFSGFSGEWEKKKLKDVGNSVIGLTYSPNDISDKGYLVLRACNVKDNQLSFDDQIFVNTRIPEKLTVHKGDILICARSGSQHLIGKNAYIDKDYPNYTFGAFMCVFRCEGSSFVFQGFQTSCIKKQILENQGARINQITTANINAFSMYFPSIEEQTKIANFLTLFDRKIEKQAEKVAALEGKRQTLPTSTGDG